MSDRHDDALRRREHREWVRLHGDALSETGVPLRVFETPERWQDFLENGHLHWHPDAGRFCFEDLGAESRAALHRFLERTSEPASPPALLRMLRVLAAPGRTSDGLPVSPDDAVHWLASRGASPRLVRHHELVLEAARELLEGLRSSLPSELDTERVLLGAAVHDAGKIEHPHELSALGSDHECAGEQLLLRSGFAPEVARCCVTHAAWSGPRAELEDRLVALADKLWKGKRDADLEQALVDEFAQRTGRAAWEVFDSFDWVCEAVAARGSGRLRRSAVDSSG